MEEKDTDLNSGTDFDEAIDDELKNLDRDDYGQGIEIQTVDPEEDEPERKKRPFPFFTLLLVILLGAAAAFLIFVFKSISETGGMMEGISGRNILGVQSRANQSSENTEYSDYRELSASLSRLAATHKEWTNIEKNPDETGFSCIATEDEGVRMVYNLDQNSICGKYTLRDFDYIWVDSVNPGFCCLINIPGEEVDLSGYYILVHDDSGNLASRLIINCYEAKVVKLNKAIISGTILAPDANVEYDATVVYGAVYAKASTGARAYFKHIAFSGYTEILKDSKKFEFVNVVMRSKTLAWLREHYPEQYLTYPDDYVLNTDDLLKITDLDLEGEYIADMYKDLDALVNLESLSLSKTKIKELDLRAQIKLRYLDISDTDIGYVMLPETCTVEEFNADNAKLYILDAGTLKNAKTVLLKNNKFMIQPAYELLEKAEYICITNTGADNASIGKLYTLKNLKHLEAPENESITEVDLSGFAVLEFADFRDCSISSIVFAMANSLKDIDVSYNDMIEIDAKDAPHLSRIAAYGDYKRIIVRDSTVAVYSLDTTKIAYGGN